MRHFAIGDEPDGTFCVEVATDFVIIKRVGFASIAAAYAWAYREIYGRAHAETT